MSAGGVFRVIHSDCPDRGDSPGMGLAAGESQSQMTREDFQVFCDLVSTKTFRSHGPISRGCNRANLTRGHEQTNKIYTDLPPMREQTSFFLAAATNASHPGFRLAVARNSLATRSLRQLSLRLAEPSKKTIKHQPPITHQKPSKQSTKNHQKATKNHQNNLPRTIKKQPKTIRPSDSGSSNFCTRACRENAARNLV